jgi:hypothetical protein
MKLQLIAFAAFVASVIALPLAEMPGSESKRDAMPQVRCFIHFPHIAIMYNT